jgi:hypothetical protein
LVNVRVFGALPLITAVTISEARLTSDSVRATWERSDLRCSASSNTVEKVSQILLYLPHNSSNLLRQFFFTTSRIMPDKIDLDIFEFFSQFLFNFCCFKQTFRCRLAERLYADIDFVSGSTVKGVLYLISEANLTRLDAYEGYPKVYRRLWLEVEFDGGIYQAITYEMSRWTKFIRSSKRYPEEYRKICSFGADYYGIKNNFKK